MKTPVKSPFILPALVAVLGLILSSRLSAQTFTTLYSFSSEDTNYFNHDGCCPGGLISSGDTLYGTAAAGGSSGNGTVFAVKADGTGFTNLHSFTTSSTNSSGAYTNSDGAHPSGDLVLSSNSLYGTAQDGGSSGSGTVFAINADGTGFTVLHHFTAAPYNGSCCNTNSDGAGPETGLILSNNTLYGTTGYGGRSGNGTVFKVNTDATGFTVLHHFTATSGGGINSDGVGPRGRLVLSGNTLYGTAEYGGSYNNGTIFKVNTDGTGFRTLYIFPCCAGLFPTAGLVLSGNTLYGTVPQGGSFYSGTVFAIKTDGTGFTVLHNFTEGDYENQAALTLSGSTLYGTTTSGGSSGNGTVFALNTDGTGFTNLHSFTPLIPYYTNDAGFVYLTNSEGASPSSAPILSGSTLYGTAGRGGSSDSGTVFSISLPAISPQLNIMTDRANVILAWPINATGFTLQSTTNMIAPTVWTTVSPAPVIVNGQNTVTNLISGTRKFYRLSQ